MKKLLLVQLIILLGAVKLLAQDPVKWGKIDKEDLEMSVYPEDSSAAAVVLADYGIAYFTFHNDKGFQLNVDRHTRIKILNKNGLEYANQQVVLYHKGTNKEEVIGLKAITYNLEDGKIQKADIKRKEAFTEVYDENINILKFTLPNVKEGSVIEFKYTLKSDFIYNLVTWEFQRDIPVKWSEFKAKVPEYFSYKHFMSGFLSVTVAETHSYKDSFNYRYEETVRDQASFRGKTTRVKQSTGTVRPEGTIYRWAMGHVPAIKEEAYITTISDYTSRIEFELNHTKFPGQAVKYFSNSWEKLNEEFMKDSRFGQQLSRARYMQEVLSGLLTQAGSEQEKIARITTYFKTNFTYNGRQRVYPESSLKKVFDEKQGNAAEINLLLTLMLREAGFAANPVILSTRGNGRVNPVIPLEKDFNYVVAHVRLEDGYLLLDATDPSLPVGMLPFKCLNQQGRLISADYTTWVPLLNREMIKNTSSAEFMLSESGAISGRLDLKHEGYAAVSNRTRFNTSGQDKYLEEVYGDKGWAINEYSIDDAEVVSNELHEHITIEIPEAVTLAGDRMYFQPLLIHAENENPFKLENRAFPVDFGCPVETFSMVKIQLPEGYEAEELPEPMVLSLPEKSGTFRYSVSRMDNELIIVNMLKISKPLYVPEEYLALKKFYELVVAKHAEQVVLKKIN